MTTREEIWQEWADRLFSKGGQLRQPTYFWAKAWEQDDVGFFYDFEVLLEQLEYQIIGLTSDLLLNREGAYSAGAIRGFSSDFALP